MDGLVAYVQKYAVYFEEIRKRVYRLVVVFTISLVIGFFAANAFIKFLIQFLHIQNVVIVATSPFQLINLAFDIAFFLATLVTLPLAVYQIYTFLRSGLLPPERRVFLRLIPAAAGLFLVGFLYGLIVMYYALQFIASVNVELGVANLWNITQFISQIVTTATLLGILFEFPIVLSFLMRVGIMRVEFLQSKRRHAVVVILIVVALLAPVDAVTYVVMCAPLLLMYEATIRMHVARTKRNARITI